MNQQADNFAIVYKKCADLDNKPSWTDIDDEMSHLDYLDDVQVCIEADVVYEEHRKGSPRCREEHPIENCIVPRIIKVVDAILEAYRDDGNLALQDRQVLQYYITLNYLGIILY